MEPRIVYFPLAPNTKKALSVLFDALTEGLDSPQATLTVGEAVPLFAAILQLAGKLEETIAKQGQRLAICEAAFSSSKNLKRPKSPKYERLS